MNKNKNTLILDCFFIIFAALLGYLIGKCTPNSEYTSNLATMEDYLECNESSVLKNDIEYYDKKTGIIVKKIVQITKVCNIGGMNNDN